MGPHPLWDTRGVGVRYGVPMAEVTRQRVGEILRAVYEVLLGKPDGVPASEVIAQAEKRLTLTPYELGEYPSSPGRKRFEKILRFSSIPHVKAG